MNPSQRPTANEMRCPAPPRPLGRLVHCGAWLLLTGAWFIAAGCTSSSGGSGSDPLVGETYPSKNQYGPAPPTPVNSPGKTSRANDPLLGEPSPLASIPNTRPTLAINDPVAGNGPGNTFTASYTNPGSSPKVAQLAEPGSLPPGAFIPGTPTAEVLQAQLRAAHVIWQKHENVPGGVRFTCIVPNRYSPDNYFTYEAIGPDLLTAVQAVLVKIDKH